MPKAKEAMRTLGASVRAELAKRGFQSTAADGFASPGVVVVFSGIGGMPPYGLCMDCNAEQFRQLIRFMATPAEAEDH